eukprot:SAG22_NODE_219_length_14877_cov_14.334619_18_plen_61_part_00
MMLIAIGFVKLVHTDRPLRTDRLPLKLSPLGSSIADDGGHVSACWCASVPAIDHPQSAEK